MLFLFADFQTGDGLYQVYLYTHTNTRIHAGEHFHVKPTLLLLARVIPCFFLVQSYQQCELTQEKTHNTNPRKLPAKPTCHLETG